MNDARQALPLGRPAVRWISRRSGSAHYPWQSAQYEFVPHVYRHVSHFVSGLVQLRSHEPPHDSAQEYGHVAWQVAPQVSQGGHVQLLGQVHSSPKTVPLAFRVPVVSKLSTVRSSRFSVSFVRM